MTRDVSAELWWDVPIEWTEDLGCDVWILHRCTYDPVSYAATWNRSLGEVDPEAYEPALVRWIEAHENAGIHTIAQGIVNLRKRPPGEAGWARWASWLTSPGPAAADHLERMFTGVDALERMGAGAAMLGRVFQAVDGQRAVETSARDDGVHMAPSARVRMEGGLGVEVVVDPRFVPVLVQCDGTRTLGDVIAATAARTGVPDAELREAAYLAIAALLTTGLLTVVG